MLDHTSTLAAVAAGEFSLDLFQVSLTEQTDDSPVSYLGTGTLRQDSKGQLSFKMLVELKQDEFEQEISRLNNPRLTQGQIIDKRQYFRLQGRSIDGSLWVAQDLWVQPNLNLGNRLCTVEAKVRSIETRTSFKTSEGRSRCVNYIPGNCRLPFSEVIRDGATGFNHLRFPLSADAECIATKLPNYLRVEVQCPKGSDLTASRALAETVLEALGICAGAHLSAQIESTIAGGEMIETLWERSAASSELHRLEAPLSMDFPDDLSDLVSFVKGFLRHSDKPYGKLGQFWYRVLQANRSGPENQALVLTTSIEGLLKGFFEDVMRPDEEFLRQLAQAKAMVKKADIGDRAKGQLSTSIGMGQKGSPGNALRSLADDKRIPGNLAQAWLDLRPKLAHAASMGASVPEMQGLIDLNYACLELFYRLTMLVIGYRGRVRRFGTFNWPVEPAFRFAESLPLPVVSTDMHATSPDAPRNHQALMVEVLTRVCLFPDDIFDAMNSGGSRAFEKLVRSYHYYFWETAEDGFCPYGTNRGRDCFRMTRNAQKSGLPARKLHPEHAVPVAWLLRALKCLRCEGRVSRDEVARLMSVNEIILVSDAERRLLDARYKDEMPEGYDLGKSSHLMRLEVVLHIDEGDLHGTRRMP